MMLGFDFGEDPAAESVQSRPKQEKTAHQQSLVLCKAASNPQVHRWTTPYAIFAWPSLQNSRAVFPLELSTW